jgi:hypothetical protein
MESGEDHDDYIKIILWLLHWSKTYISCCPTAHLVLLLVLHREFSFLRIINTRKEVPVYTRDAEQYVHILERQPFGFWNKKVDEWYSQRHACREHEVCAISDIRKHIRHASSDNEVHQPVSCCADCHAEAADAETITRQFVPKLLTQDAEMDLREDFTAVDPWHPGP